MELRTDGNLIHDGIVIGGISQFGEEPLITLNLGWMKAAGVHVKVLGDPDQERRRVVLER